MNPRLHFPARAWCALALWCAGTAATAEAGRASPAKTLTPAPLEKKQGDGDLAALMSKVDPSSDEAAWAAEAFADKAGAVLKKLDALMAKAGALSAPACSEVAAKALQCGLLREASALRVVFRDGALVVRRGDALGKPQSATGGAALQSALASWLSAYPPGTEVHTKFKIVGVDFNETEKSARTSAFVQSAGPTRGGIIQQSATWTCGWTWAASPDHPVLTALGVSDYEEVVPVDGANGAPLFFDAAPGVLGESAAWSDLLVHGLDHWFKQVDAAFQIPQGYHGVCVSDLNGDGREDVFFCQPAGIRNLVFLRQPDGGLKEASSESGLDFLDNTRSALFIDLDNDGDADGILTLGDKVVVFENDGKAHFKIRTQVATASWLMSMAAADADLDGATDLYLCGYSRLDAQKGGDLLANPFPYHDANNGARNFLLRNEGAFRFADATRSTGLEVNNRKFTFAAAWEDYDNDGDPDLFCANDFGRKNLYRNDLIRGGKPQGTLQFVDVAAEAGVLDPGAGMSASWADHDHDGFMDLYVANMFSSAGRRIASQVHFKPRDSAENRAELLRLARGNTLFRNRGDGTFEDLAEPSATFLGRWAWGSLFCDLNNDSWEDLYVCNGFYTRPDPGDL
ncbi:MAG: VCBS repeat-containing protein [Verrucomicrobiales bacterium]|nr:VCBS repeat-containing protein [Verrucomicrobiales bacterium]